MTPNYYKVKINRVVSFFKKGGIILTKGDKTKKIILEDCLSLLKTCDISNFTLDLLADKSISTKSGILYHFTNKNNLLNTLADAIAQKFTKNFEEVARTYPLNDTFKYHKSFIECSKSDLLGETEYNLAIIISQYTHHDISDSYVSLLEKLAYDKVPSSQSNIIRMTIDGLYYSRYLNNMPLDDLETLETLNYLYTFLEEN